jgi:hypothetical protein
MEFFFFDSFNSFEKKLKQANGKLGENNCSSTLFFRLFFNWRNFAIKAKFKIRKSSDFGVFQWQELRKKSN